MGIPSYFSYIIKEHRSILKQLNTLKKIDNLYLDSNSIIYDAAYGLVDKFESKLQYENLIYEQVCRIIEQLLFELKPSRCMIAFDGVAPIAKMEQQRQRRFNSEFVKKLFDDLGHSSTMCWATNNITPGTDFMKNLDVYVSHHFSNFNRQHDFIDQIIFTGCSHPGEGEHKIFDFIRSNNHRDETTIIYGLDADLFMLCICHLEYCPNIYLYRETPEFIKSIDSSLEPNTHYLIHIYELCTRIQYNITDKPVETLDIHLLRDYVFICFMLGNDFMPHFPSINLRKDGIHILLNHYSHCIYNRRVYLTDNGKIKWREFRTLIKSLMEHEHERFIETEVDRTRLSKRQHGSVNTKEEINKKLLNIPVNNLEHEVYINPKSSGWESRYYATCFHVEKTDIRLKQICTNFLEGLEWTLKYYTTGCVDTYWKYNYHYAPLLSDIYTYVPFFDISYFNDVPPRENILPLTQLAYVLPMESRALFPSETPEQVFEYLDTFEFDYDFDWSYCRYFWESRANLPRLDIHYIQKCIRGK